MILGKKRITLEEYGVGPEGLRMKKEYFDYYISLLSMWLNFLSLLGMTIKSGSGSHPKGFARFGFRKI